jgi:hypothetical protein
MRNILSNLMTWAWTLLTWKTPPNESDSRSDDEGPWHGGMYT